VVAEVREEQVRGPARERRECMAARAIAFTGSSKSFRPSFSRSERTTVPASELSYLDEKGANTAVRSKAAMARVAESTAMRESPKTPEPNSSAINGA
jgi:hypothetical protein